LRFCCADLVLSEEVTPPLLSISVFAFEFLVWRSVSFALYTKVPRLRCLSSFPQSKNDQFFFRLLVQDRCSGFKA